VEEVGQKYYMDNFFSSPDLSDDIHTGDSQLFWTFQKKYEKKSKKLLTI
jgi:hypothetical protein